ncbi:MAG: hypothetical protein KGM17_12250 [Sphingomonadales bacterium]|nr:hypothetical protein [Sphingomonadales bacterium]
MRKIFLTAALAAMAAPIVAPVAAGAQPYRAYDRYDQGERYDRVDRGNFWRDAPNSTWDRISWIQQRIESGRADGSLSGREYWRSSSELRRIRQMAWRMRERDGGRLTPTDATYIQDRLDSLSRQVRWDRHD